MEKYELQNIIQSEFALMFAPHEKEIERGCIGYLRADFNRGKEFFSTWFDETSKLKAQDFKNEFDEVINYFRESSAAPLLKSRSDMLKMCNELKPTVYDGDNNIRGFKVETSGYTYYLKCTPRPGDYDLYCYCYNTELLTQYLKTQPLKNETANQHKGVDLRNIDLVAVYENLMEVPDSDRTTTYSLQHGTYYIKDEPSMTKACEVKMKALEFLGINQEQFDSYDKYKNMERIHRDMVDIMLRYRHLSYAADFKYLLQNMPHRQLQVVENVLDAYSKNIIALETPKNIDTQGINAEGECHVIICKPYDYLGIEKDVLKWYEGIGAVADMMEQLTRQENMKRCSMDKRMLDLIAAYEEELDMSEEKRTTRYSEQWKTFMIKDENLFEKAKSIRDDVLALMKCTLDEFISDNKFADSDFVKASVQNAVRPIRIASESFEVVEIFDKPVLFTHERLRPMDIPEGLFKYDIRQDDNGQGIMSELKNNVGVNHWGSVICKEPFEITQEHDGIICTTQEGLSMTTDDYNYTGTEMTIGEYTSSYGELLKECNLQVEQGADEMGGMCMG